VEFPPQPHRLIPRRSYLALAIGIAFIVGFGFWQSYFRPLLAGKADRPWIIHVHAAIFVGWLGLLIAQVAAIVGGRVAVHRRIGAVGAAYGGLVFVVGVVVSIAAPVIRVHSGQMPTGIAERVVLYNLTDILVFGAFLVAALATRRRPELHARWIIAATTALVGAAVGRIAGDVLYFMLWMSPLWGAIGIDLWKERRLHPIFVLSLGVFFATWFKVSVVSASPALQAIGRSLIGPFL
jgi:FtsH-binding integral membrane protein